MSYCYCDNSSSYWCCNSSETLDNKQGTWVEIFSREYL